MWIPPYLRPSASYWVSFWKVSLAEHRYRTHCWPARVNCVTYMLQFGKIRCETVRLKGCRGSPRHTIASAVSLQKELLSKYISGTTPVQHTQPCVSHGHRLPAYWSEGCEPPHTEMEAEGPHLSHPLPKKKQNRQHQASASTSILYHSDRDGEGEIQCQWSLNTYSSRPSSLNPRGWLVLSVCLFVFVGSKTKIRVSLFAITAQHYPYLNLRHKAFLSVLESSPLLTGPTPHFRASLQLRP